MFFFPYDLLRARILLFVYKVVVNAEQLGLLRGANELLLFLFDSISEKRFS